MSIEKSIEKIIEGLRMLQDNLGDTREWNAEKETPEPDAPAPKTEKKKTKKKAPKKEEKPDYPLVKNNDNEDVVLSPTNIIKNFSYRDLKGMCAELDLGGVGKTEELQIKLLDYIDAEIPDELQEYLAESEEEEDSAQEAELIEDEDDEEIAEEVETEEQTLYDKVEQFLEDEGYTVEDLADILSDIGYSPKGKRQALVSKIVDAIEAGDLEFEVEEVEEIEEEEVEEEPLKLSLYLNDYIEIDSSDEREEAVEAEIAEWNEAFEKDEISIEEIVAFLEDYFAFDDEIVDEIEILDEESLLTVYNQIQANFVDDDGEVHELEEPYTLNGEFTCCGKFLVELDNENLYCEICETEYETE